MAGYGGIGLWPVYGDGVGVGGEGIDCVKSIRSQLGYACVLTINVILVLLAAPTPLF